MRIVLDTNVWISALLFPRGVCDQLLKGFLQHTAVELVSSPFILHEIEQVVRIKFDYSRSEADSIRLLVEEMSTVVEPQEHVRVVPEKEADNRILECAISCKADLLVTGDTKHLLPLKAFRGVPIRSPREVLDHWQSLQ